MPKVPGTFTFRFRGSDEVYRVKSATLSVKRTEEGVELFFYVRTEKGTIGPPREGYLATAPNAEVLVCVDDFDPDGLVGQTFRVPVSYDAVRKDHVAAFYYHEHDDLSDNVVEIISRDRKKVHVRWTAKAHRVQTYGTDNTTPVVIDAWFELADD
jgi:hypothetical protein